MLDWSIVELARAAGVSVSTVKRMEMIGPQPVSETARAMVRQALEAAGMRFLADGDSSEGMWRDRV